MNEILTAEGHEVDLARTGTEAWQKLSASTYDAIFCAVVLPGLDGVALYRRVVNLRPEIVSRFVPSTSAALPRRRARRSWPSRFRSTSCWRVSIGVTSTTGAAYEADCPDRRRRP